MKCTIWELEVTDTWLPHKSDAQLLIMSVHECVIVEENVKLTI